ncbi:hypothetical protein BDV96DRAFT_691764 [Lophiotrema nucula]|uniref:Uncharacterized protein n=1 Tax=Lophiotrema nucula TaxID=690887 RepID=A0A6A5YS18_9PLEO|nr:hypothetical protein BDV96DRAFT_691764 [Lophiotrema nucula]
MHFTVKSLLFLLAVHTASAAPATEIAKRAPPLPSVDDCKAHLKVDKDTSMFYTGGSGNKQARDWIKRHPDKSAYKTLRDHYTDPSWADQWQNDPDVSTSFFNIMSRAYAELSSGTIYTMLDGVKGWDWEKGRTWDAFEWPYFSDDARIVKVTTKDDEEILKGADSPLWPPVTPGDYEKGHCTLHAVQWDLDPKQTGENRYDVEVRIFSNKGSSDTIGFHPPMNAGPEHTLRIVSKLANTMEVTPEAQNDYIQFTVGDVSWKSSDSGDDKGCKVGDWDGSDYPAFRQMDCGFPC